MKKTLKKLLRKFQISKSKQKRYTFFIHFVVLPSYLVLTVL